MDPPVECKFAIQSIAGHAIINRYYICIYYSRGAAVIGIIFDSARRTRTHEEADERTARVHDDIVMLYEKRTGDCRHV